MRLSDYFRCATVIRDLPYLAALSGRDCRDPVQPSPVNLKLVEDRNIMLLVVGQQLKQ